MSIDRFGLGDWWPRPRQAAAGALDHLPPDQWPALAAKWLAAGFDSQSLRQLAQLQTGESPASLRADRRSSSRRGGGWAQLDGPGQPVPVELRRLHRRHRTAADAMELMPEVLRSLGFDPAPADEEFMARCQQAVEIVQRDLDATGTLKEIPEIEWPVCVIHGGHPGSVWDGEEPVDLIKKVAWWRCTNTGHSLAPVGQLTAETARTL
jgi:hypothetical protein